MGKGKKKRKRKVIEGKPEPEVMPEGELVPGRDANNPLLPTKIEGRCAYCPCGARIEMPSPPPKKERGAGVKRCSTLRCEECISFVKIEETFE